MGSEMAVQDGEWKKAAKEWYERGLVLQEEGRELRLDVAEHIMQAHDQEYYKTIGYKTFEEFAEAFYGISKTTAHQYLRIAENVVHALPEEVCAALTNGDNPLPLKVLAALHFDQINMTPEFVEHLRKMEPEEQKRHLLALGYDRERMGGRGPSDLSRRLIGRKTHRDQSRKLQVYREQVQTLKGEKEEMAEAHKALLARLQQVLDAIQDPTAAKTVKTLDTLTARLAELEKKSAEAEAEIATGKEVGTRALILSGEIQALLSQFEDGVRIDKKAQWVEVRAILHSAQDAIEQTLGRMAEVIIARVDSGEITRFSVEDPEGESGAAAEGLSEPGSRRK